MRMSHVVGLFALAAIWGASFMFVEVALTAMGPVAVGWVRLGGGALLLLTLAAVRGARLPHGARSWFDVAMVGLLASAAPLVLIPWGQQAITSGLAGVLNGAMPLFVALLAHHFLPAERLSATRSFGLVLGFVGLVVLIGADLLDVASESTQGQLAVVLATVGYAAGAVYIRRRLLAMDLTVLAGVQSAVAFLLVTPMLLLAEDVPDVRQFSLSVGLAVAALALLSSGAAYLIYYWLLATLHATQVSVVTYLIPVFALLLGWLVLDETLARSAIPGLVLIAGGIWLVNRPQRAGRPPQTEQVLPAPAAVATEGTNAAPESGIVHGRS